MKAGGHNIVEGFEDNCEGTDQICLWDPMGHWMLVVTAVGTGAEMFFLRTFLSTFLSDVTLLKPQQMLQTSIT